MIPLTFANLIEVHIHRVQHQEKLPGSVMLLLDEVNRRVLAIWIGQAEAHALVGALLYARSGSTLKRPMTWNFINQVLEAAAAELENVTISALKETIFYATVRLNIGGTVHEIDARPSDAIPLALLLNKPLLVTDDEIAPEAWWPVPEGFIIDDSLLCVRASGLEFDLEAVHLEFDTIFDEAEWQQLDDATKKAYSHEHEQALRDRILSS